MADLKHSSSFAKRPARVNAATTILLFVMGSVFCGVSCGRQEVSDAPTAIPKTPPKLEIIGPKPRAIIAVDQDIPVVVEIRSDDGEAAKRLVVTELMFAGSTVDTGLAIRSPIAGASSTTFEASFKGRSKKGTYQVRAGTPFNRVPSSETKEMIYSKPVEFQVR